MALEMSRKYFPDEEITTFDSYFPSSPHVPLLIGTWNRLWCLVGFFQYFRIRRDNQLNISLSDPSSTDLTVFFIINFSIATHISYIVGKKENSTRVHLEMTKTHTKTNTRTEHSRRKSSCIYSK